MTLTKTMTHLAVRFYRSGGIEVVLVPLLAEVATFTRSAGDGYFLVSLIGEPGTAYPLNLLAPAAFEPGYLAEKFHLDRRGYGCTPEELAAILRDIAADIQAEAGFDA